MTQPTPQTPLPHVVIVGNGMVGHRLVDNLRAGAGQGTLRITVISEESLPPGVGLLAVRRNILLRGLLVDDLVGQVLTLDSGDGPVRLQVNSRAHPCAWMDVTVGPGAWKALRRKGGIRCTPLDDGVLRLGPVKATVT